jgi:hypothetical protein
MAQIPNPNTGESSMDIRPKVAILAAVLTASAASPWAAHELQNSTLVPAPVNLAPAERESAAVGIAATPPAADPVVTADEAVVTPDGPAVVAKETEVTQRTGPIAVRATAPPRAAITITEPRLTQDQRIQADVMDLLARNPNLSGRIGVVSEDATVTLTGWTATSGQAWRAGRDARGVIGVRHVVNEIRPRVGGISS